MKIILTSLLYLTIFACSGCVLLQKNGTSIGSSKRGLGNNARIAIRLSIEFDYGFNTEELTQSDIAEAERLISSGCIGYGKSYTYLVRATCEIMQEIKTESRLPSIQVVSAAQDVSGFTRVVDAKLNISEDQSLFERSLQIVNFATVMIIPYRGKRDFHLELAEVTKTGQLSVIATYENEVLVWRQILLLPLLPFVDGYGEGLRKVHRKIGKEILGSL
jgi:hypothetical protein